MAELLMLADSLSGTGHQRRAELLCRALLSHGYAVTYLSHALFDTTLRQASGLRYVALPAYAGTLDDPKALLAVKLERLRRILHLRRETGPFAALICEHYPIGKHYLDEEVALLVRNFKAVGTQLLCVYRDIVDDGDLAQVEGAVARLNRHFDGLLVLADPAVLPLPPALTAQLTIPVTYLGYLDPHPRRSILVFGGGGKLNATFYRQTLAVLQTLAARFPIDARLYVGDLVDDATWATLAAHGRGAVQVHRAAADLYAEMAAAAITVSTLGYNTFVELLHFNNVNVIVPLAHNDEQRTRAHILARLKPGVHLLELDEAYAPALAALLEREVTAALQVEGLRNFVAAIAACCPLAESG